MIRYYDRIIKAFADISSPLHALTAGKHPFAWPYKQMNSFFRLKDAGSSIRGIYELFCREGRHSRTIQCRSGSQNAGRESGRHAVGQPDDERRREELLRV